MKEIKTSLTNKFLIFISNNLWVTFLINIKSLIDSLIWVKGLIFNNLKMNDFTIDYNAVMLLILSVFVYFMFKFMLKYIDFVAEKTTNNINDLSRVLDLKIRYVNFENNHKSLDNDAYVKKIIEYGFSKEDLEEIGVENIFLTVNKNRLLPKKVMEKFNDFKGELENHYKSKGTTSVEN
jgi:hypothetical protein